MMPRPVDLRRMIEQAVVGTEPAAHRRDISLRVQVADDVPELIGDQDLLLQALRNVLINALRHTPKGGEIRIEAAYADESIEIAVQDSGAGIGAAHRERIFQPFDRGDTRDADGMGLGLSISRNIAIEHGGGLTVRNKPGRGACFVFRFPVAESGWRAWMTRATQRAIDEVGTLSAPLACVLLSFEANSDDPAATIHPDLLSVVQQLAVRSLRPSDTVLAINDRLLLLIRGSTRSGAHAMIDRILESLIALFSADRPRFGACYMTFGAAAYPQDGADAAAILARCEKELSLFPIGRSDSGWGGDYEHDAQNPGD